MYTPPEGNDSLGKEIHEESRHSLHSLAVIFRMKNEWEKQNTHIGFKNLKDLIKKQISRFPTTRNFDYSQTIKSGIMSLESIFVEPQLTHIIDTITKYKNASKEKCSKLYEDLHYTRVRMCMIVALLCFTMNPQCLFIHTLLGLVCYAYGLRDKGFELLNTMGCTCSIDHIRTHGAYWASRHKPILQLNPTGFWQITIDNLNFYLKFAKSLTESSSGAKKMLNLLTGQVTHQVSPRITKQVGPLPLLEQVHLFIANSIHTNLSSKLRSAVQIQDFNNLNGVNENYYYEMFLQVCFYQSSHCWKKYGLFPVLHQPQSLQPLFFCPL